MNVYVQRDKGDLAIGKKLAHRNNVATVDSRTRIPTVEKTAKAGSNWGLRVSRRLASHAVVLSPARKVANTQHTDQT